MVNFGPLAAEIGWPVWGTPANFNGFRILAALLHGSQVVGVSKKFAALNRGRHLCSAGRPSRWALAHILVLSISNSFHSCLFPSSLLPILWEDYTPKVTPAYSVRPIKSFLLTYLQSCTPW